MIALRTRALTVAVLALAVPLAGCSGGSTPTPAAATSRTAAKPPADGGTYPNADAILSKLSVAGLACPSQSAMAESAAVLFYPGATSLTSCSSPGGVADDTQFTVFDTPAHLAAFEKIFEAGGDDSASGQLAGQNWALESTPTYAARARAVLGGRLTVIPADTSPPTVPAPAVSASTVSDVVLQESGNGIESTQSFTVDDDWALAYTFNCSNFGSQGNFQVFEDYPDGDTLVNSLADSGSDTTYQTGDAGAHTLKVNSECNWTIKVINDDDGQ